MLVTDDGSQLILREVTVLGRKPSVKNASEGAHALPLPDPQRVLSRTHALVEVRDGVLSITDLGSTNGTDLIAEDGGETACEAHRAYELSDGQRLSLGGLPITIKRTT